MRILRHYDGVPDDVRGCAVVLGNFDGVHRGHQEVIGGAVADAAAQGLPLAVVTFEPHPRSFFAPDQPPFRLTPFRSKAIHLAALKVDVLMVLAFNEAMSQVGAEDFVQRVLIDGVGARQAGGFQGAQREGNHHVIDSGQPQPKKRVGIERRYSK